MSDPTESVRLVAVTACPTGIAHSQMAAESLETTATELGHEIAVEVRGAMGTQNELTAADIDAADAAIVAADTAVPRDRFDSIPVIKGTVKDGVNDAAGLVERAVEAAAESTADAGGESGSVAGSEGDPDPETKSPPYGTEASDPSDGNHADQHGGRERRPTGENRPAGLLERLRRLFT